MLRRLDAIARRYRCRPSALLVCDPVELAIDSLCADEGWECEDERVKAAGMVFPVLTLGGG